MRQELANRPRARPDIGQNQVAEYYKETKLALDSKEVREGLAQQGITVIGNTPAQAAQFFQSELVKHAALVKRSGASLD